MLQDFKIDWNVQTPPFYVWSFTRFWTLSDKRGSNEEPCNEKAWQIANCIKFINCSSKTIKNSPNENQIKLFVFQALRWGFA